MTKHFFKLAALLLLGAVGCSKIANLSEEAPVASSKYFVSVGGRLPQTRSVGVNTDGTWTLQFTESDELFVSGKGVDGISNYFLAGTLHVVPGSISEGDGRSARFEGELTVYEQIEEIMGYEEIWIDDDNYEEGGYFEEDPNSPIIDYFYESLGYDLSDYDNPLDACEYVDVRLIPSGDWTAFYKPDEVTVEHELYEAFALSIEQLMESYVDVWGSYDPLTSSFVLDGHYPIFDITVKGLEPDCDYEIQFAFVEDPDDLYTPYCWNMLAHSSTPFSANSDGDLHFVTGTYNLYNIDTQAPVCFFVTLDSVNGVDSYIAKIGAKELEKKIYTITRTAEPQEVPDPVFTITGDCEENSPFFTVVGDCWISGEGTDYFFLVDEDCTLTLDSVTLSTDSEEVDPISSLSDNTYYLALYGVNYINAPNRTFPLYGSGILVIGEGSLIITSLYHGDFPLEDFNIFTTDDYSLTYDFISDNEDGTYTYRIDVYPS